MQQGGYKIIFKTKILTVADSEDASFSVAGDEAQYYFNKLFTVETYKHRLTNENKLVSSLPSAYMHIFNNYFHRQSQLCTTQMFHSHS